MTHLETLVRILPRQRRNLLEQRKIGLGLALLGLVVAGPAAIIAADRGIGPWSALFLIVGGSWELAGIYRHAHADVVLARVEGQLEAVLEALDEEREIIARGDINFHIQANTEDMVRAIRLELDKAANIKGHRA